MYCRFEIAFFGQFGDGVVTEAKLTPIFGLLGIDTTQTAIKVGIGADDSVEGV